MFSVTTPKPPRIVEKPLVPVAPRTKATLHSNDQKRSTMRSLYLLFALAMVEKGVAQQAGTLDSTFSWDGIFHFPPELELQDRAWSVQEIEPDRFVLIDDSIAYGHVRVGVLADVGTDTLLLENGLWSVDLAPHHGTSYADGRLTFYSAIDSVCTISRYYIDGTLDAEFGVDGELTILLQGEFNADEAFIRGCTEATNGDWYCWVEGSFEQSYSTGYLIKTNEAGALDGSFGTNGVKSFGPVDHFVEVKHLSGSNTLVWLSHSSTTPFTPPHHSLRIIDGNGALLQNINLYAGNFVESEITSVLLNPAEMILAAQGGSECHARFRAFELGSQVATYMDIFAESEFEYYEYPFVKSFAVDMLGRFYYTGDPSVFDAWAPPWIIARRNGDGTRDMEFGLIDEPFVSNASIRGGLVQADGKLLVYGFASDQQVIVRYHNIPDPRSTLSLRMFLGGAYDENTGLMRDDLRQQDLIPTLQPYASPFFSAANGVGSWATPQHVLEVQGDSAVVDWVWLELLSSADSSNVVATRVGLLHRNGWVTSADGHSPIDFSAGAGSYFVRARHRNHLSVTASQAITLGPSVTTLDVTDPTTATFGTDAQKEINGVRMLWPGDATSDGAVKYVGPYNDRDRILIAIGASATATVAGYRTEDLNLDGVTKYVGTGNDRDVILQTIGGTVPTAVRVAQQP